MSAEVLQENQHQFKETNPTGDQTIILVPGAAGNIKIQEPFAEALATEGYRVLSFDYVTEPGVANRHHDAKIKQVGEVMQDGLEDGKQATIFANSHGVPIAIDATLQDPEKVDRLILANPAGLFKDSFIRLAGRFALESIPRSLVMRKTSRVAQQEGTKHMVAHPRDFIGDAIDTSRTDISSKLKELQEKGIRVDLLISAKDQVFPWRLQKDYFEGQDPEKFDFASVSSYFNTKPGGKQHRFASKWAGHGQNIVYPEQTAKLVKQLLAQ